MHIGPPTIYMPATWSSGNSGCLHLVEWNSGMDYWNCGMLHRTSNHIIQHVLYSEQWALHCACMHCWLDSWLARLVLHCMNFELWPRPGYTFTLWCMQGNQAPQYVSHLITNCHLSFFTYCTSTVSRRILACMQRIQHRVHCTTHAGWLGMSYEAFHHSTIPFHWM